MKNKFKNKTVGIGPTPMFLNGMPFYIQMDVIPIRKEDRSSKTQMFEDKQLGKTSVDKDLIQIELLEIF